MILDNEFYELPKIEDYENKYAYSLIDGKPEWKSTDILKTYSIDGNINVKTCFITNLENENAVISDLELDKKLKKLRPKKKDNRKFTPKNYITSAQFIKYVKYGVNIKKSDIIDLKKEYNNKKTYGYSIVVKEDNIPWEI